MSHTRMTEYELKSRRRQSEWSEINLGQLARRAHIARRIQRTARAQE